MLHEVNSNAKLLVTVEEQSIIGVPGDSAFLTNYYRLRAKQLAERIFTTLSKE